MHTATGAFAAGLGQLWDTQTSADAPFIVVVVRFGDNG